MFNKRKEEKSSSPTPGPSVASAGRRPSDETPSPAPAPRAEIRPSSLGSRGYQRPARSSAPAATESTVMNPHLSFQGEVKYSGTLTIDCEFRGSVVTDDTLIIGPSAKVEAEIRAGVVEISGKLHGNVQAKQRVKIFTGGEIYGNVETPTIGMEDGVVFEGSCTRPQGVETPPARKTPPSTSVEDVLGGGAGETTGTSDSETDGDVGSRETSRSAETEPVGQP